MYLYLGYLLIQLSPLMVKVFQLNISISAMFYSFIVVFIWSFIPFLGYGIAKLLNANANADKYRLFSFGVGIGLVEGGLFYFDILTNDQSTIGTLIVFILFFIVAYFPRSKAVNNH